MTPFEALVARLTAGTLTVADIEGSPLDSLEKEALYTSLLKQITS